jgi:GlcNAc-P-P-Und epimerase
VTRDAGARLVLIGGSGFIGTRLAERLERRGADFVIADIAPSVRFPDRRVALDVRDREAVRRLLRPRDVPILLAAVHRDDVRPVSLYHETNVGGAESLLAALTAADLGRVVFTSSVAVYGNVTGVADEATPCSPVNEYGRTKLLAEERFRQWQAADPARTTVILRPTVVFGEGNRGNVYNLLSAVAGRRYAMVGSGAARKSTAYVENVAAAIEWCVEQAPGLHVFNYVDEPDFTMTQLVERARSLMGLPAEPTIRLPRGLALALGRAADVVATLARTRLPLSAIRVEKFTQDTAVSAARIRAAGFRPEVPLDEGLRRFVLADFVRVSRPPTPTLADTGRTRSA